MAPLKYILALFVATSWFATGFLSFLAPTVVPWIFWLSLACWIPLFFVFVSVLIRRRWKAAAMVSTALALGILCFVEPESVEPFRFWLLVQGFRIHAAPVEQYLSKCELTAFTEDGIGQQLGVCEGRMVSSNLFDAVFYDTTGQFALPPARRTKGWQDAMYPNNSHCYLTEKAIAQPLFGKFYIVMIEIEHVGGC